MAYPRALLSPGEEVVLDLHPHWRALVVPLGLLPVVIGVASFLAAEAPDGSARHPFQLAILIVAVLILLVFSLRPSLRWQTTHYVVTSRRVVLRVGLLARSGRDVPLRRVNDVTFHHTVWERLLRTGTLSIESAGEQGQVTLTDVPHVERVQRTVYELVEAADGRQGDGRRDA